jgi:hypothetical protein
LFFQGADYRVKVFVWAIAVIQERMDWKSAGKESQM